MKNSNYTHLRSSYFLLPVPYGTWSRWANGSHGSHGAPPHERITRWVDLPRDAPETGGIPQTKLTLAVLFLLRVWGHGRVAKGEYRSRFGGVFSISSTCSDSHRSCVLPPQSSPNNMGGMNNPPGTPRDDGEMGGNFLNPFQSESVSRASQSRLTALNAYPRCPDMNGGGMQAEEGAGPESALLAAPLPQPSGASLPDF